ncbi:hypothetical protein ABH942_002144 [Flavobacterium sp. 28YEA47A]|uniref:T9SS type A sorting domain-containing protein n=1 Tax=Flavobacterium sp. 28YEA47A TaxID=3156276 RepID=UPI0035158EF8
MKKITLLLMLFVSVLSYGQAWTIASCLDTDSVNYGPMYSTTTANATSRMAVIYPASQLSGIAGQVLNAAYFRRVSASGTMAGTPNFKIYLKEVSNSDWGSDALDWATATTGAVMVYDSNPATAVGSSAGWKSFAFTNTFTYSGAQNLAVFMEYTNATASSSITWSYEFYGPCINESNSNTTKYSNVTTGTLPASLTSTNYRRPLIAFDFVVSCNVPTAVTSTAVTSNSATVNWTAPLIVPSEGYEYYLSTSSTTPLPSATPTGSVAAGVTTKSFTGLPSATQHYVWVRSNCGPTDKSTWVRTTFTTACGLNVPTYLQDFNGTTFPPQCWTTAGAGDELTGPTGTAAGIWGAGGFLNVGTTGAARVNLYSSNRKGWLISPPIDMSAGGYRVRFDVGVTAYSGTGPAQIVSDDKVVFLASQDNGVTWTIIHTWDSTNSPTNERTLYSANLPSYVGANTKFAFYATDGPIDDIPDYNFYVDNFLVEAIPSCEAPLNIGVTGITPAGAIISWDAVTGSAGYEYVLDQVATNPTGAGTTITAAPYTASGLAGNTTYYFHVRNNCGTEFSAWTTRSFKTLPNPPANDDCINAVTLTVNPNFTCTAKTAGTLLGATDSGEPDNGAGTPNDDVWYKFVATATSHRITLSNVTGTPTDLVHEVLEGNCGGGLISLNISDPDTSNLTNLIPGNTYYVRIFSYSAATGATTSFDVCVGTFPPPPANDDCINAVTLTVNPNLACGVKTSGTLQSATDSGEGDNGAGVPDDDVWYKFVATATSHRIVISNVAGTPTDLVHEVLDGTCGGGLISLIVSDPNTSTVTGLIPGSTYYVRVFSLATAAITNTTTFDICIGTLPGPPANDNCSGAIALTVNADLACGVKTSGTLQSATDSGVPDNGAGTPNDDVWYTFVATTGSHTIALSNVVGNQTDMVHELMTGTCNGLVSLNVSDPNTSTYTGLTPGATYYVRIFSFGTATDASTTFDVCIGSSAAPAVPANNEPSGAVNLTINPALTCTATTAGTTIGATQSAVPAPACSAAGFNDDVWYTFTPTVNRARFTFTGTATGTTMVGVLYTGTPGSLVEVTGSCAEGNTLNFANLTPGTVYYARVFTNSALPIVSTAFTLCVSTPPVVPVNDNCSGAIALTPAGDFTTGAIVGTVAGATTVTGLTYACQTNRAEDVWYSVVVPASGRLTIETKAQTGSTMTDSVLSVFSGTCTSLTEVSCDDDTGDGNFSMLTVTNQTPGATLYIGVWRYGTAVANTGEFRIAAYDASLSTPTFGDANFRAYPNPVVDVLNLSYTQEISNVAVFNLLGQQVISKTIGATDASVDMSSLAGGTYLVKVTVDNQVKTIKVIKQ